ncbi:hypothetical protein NDK47_26305 [Brevibacillus ruminantium]|uniref:Transcription initiation factor TFIID n=1 Tax=Brevibacillus ruminantium TaxID=2950604 RepID=A0ABY4WEH6_9BACL|nr:hypothetical protein [Brevibacillus ruminantium]USG65571.1 hypothetical protein NDK47_26305 [Brevibacillus ruminantium]
MRDLIEQLATNYATGLHTQLDSGNGQRSIQNPVLFLFIGDDSLEALQAVYSSNERQWQNHGGVLYLHAGSADALPGPQVYGCPLPSLQASRKTLRSDLYDAFYEDEPLRIEINKVMKLASIQMAEAGRHCTSVQHVHVAVVTRADDPANVLVPELTLLLKSYLSEVFKHVSMDLYTLIQDKSSGEEFGFSAALGVSFLEELTVYQRSDYRFRKPLQVTEDQVTLEVAHTGSPLFSLIYLLSDKNERGLFAENGQQDNYELISHLVLLNNKPAETELGEGNESYNKHQFIRSITVDSGHIAFATAGYSRVKQPREAIALTVLSHVYDDLLRRLKGAELPDLTELLEPLELSNRHIHRKVQSILPDGGKLEEMTGLMATGVSYAELKNMSLKEAEQVLFQGSSQHFFEKNFTEPARKNLEALQSKGMLPRLIREAIIENPRLGLYTACRLTAGASGAEKDCSIRAELLARIRETTRLLEETRAEWEELYRERVEQQDFKKGGFFTREKDRVRNFIRHFFPLMYGKRYELLGLEMELQLLRDYEQQIEEMHRQLQEEWERLESLQKQLQELSRKRVQEASDYLGKNIDQYYGAVVKEVISSLEARRGPSFYWEERHLGQLSNLLKDGMAALIERLTRLCHQEVMSSPPFAMAFEDELLARANVTVAYENREVLTKEELFEDLYRALEERAAVHMEVFHFTQKHRYEEKYFFADNHSEFIQYVIGLDQTARTCKQGYVHEEGKGGIEKLNLMGGFTKEDLMYYRNNKKYYDSYVANGFVFHRREEGVSI